VEYEVHSTGVSAKQKNNLSLRTAVRKRDQPCADDWTVGKGKGNAKAKREKINHEITKVASLYSPDNISLLYLQELKTWTNREEFRDGILSSLRLCRRK